MRTVPILSKYASNLDQVALRVRLACHLDFRLRAFPAIAVDRIAPRIGISPQLPARRVYRVQPGIRRGNIHDTTATLRKRKLLVGTAVVISLQ